MLSTVNDVAAWLRDGMTIGIGGWGLDRKPMSLVHAVARSSVRHLTVTTAAGGMDVEVLIGAGKVQRVVSCHVGLDHLGLAPRFRAAREAGRLQFEEWSEWTLLAAWRAAAEGVPFATVQFDPGSQLLQVNPHLRLTRCPFSDREVVAVAAPQIDLALLHAEAAHPDGWAVTGGDAYADVLLARCARTVILSAERLMDDRELEERYREVHLIASYVDAVVEAPRGALPGSCLPQYTIDLKSLRTYIETSGEDVREGSRR